MFGPPLFNEDSTEPILADSTTTKLVSNDIGTNSGETLTESSEPETNEGFTPLPEVEDLGSPEVSKPSQPMSSTPRKNPIPTSPKPDSKPKKTTISGPANPQESEENPEINPPVSTTKSKPSPIPAPTPATTEAPLEDYNDRTTKDRLSAISVTTGEHSLGKDSQANVTIEICPHGYKCCQTNSLDQPGRQDLTRVDKERKFLGKPILGSCYNKKFPVEQFKKNSKMGRKKVKDDGIPNSVMKSVKVTFMPNDDRIRVHWNPKDVVVCFSDGRRPPSFHSLWCKDLEHQGIYGPDETTKELIEKCKWFNDLKC